MNCLELSVRRYDNPVSFGVQRHDAPMAVSVGLVCTPEDTNIKLLSSDGLLLESHDGYILCSKQN